MSQSAVRGRKKQKSIIMGRFEVLLSKNVLEQRAGMHGWMTFHWMMQDQTD